MSEAVNNWRARIFYSKIPVRHHVAPSLMLYEETADGKWRKVKKMKKNLKMKLPKIVEMKAVKGKSLTYNYIDRILVSTEPVEGIDPLDRQTCEGTLFFIPKHLPKDVLAKTEEWKK
jgi:hypothetical protein